MGARGLRFCRRRVGTLAKLPAPQDSSAAFGKMLVTKGKNHGHHEPF